MAHKTTLAISVGGGSQDALLFLLDWLGLVAGWFRSLLWEWLRGG